MLYGNGKGIFFSFFLPGWNDVKSSGTMQWLTIIKAGPRLRGPHWEDLEPNHQSQRCNPLTSCICSESVFQQSFALDGGDPLCQMETFWHRCVRVMTPKATYLSFPHEQRVPYMVGICHRTWRLLTPALTSGICKGVNYSWMHSYCYSESFF